MKGMPENRYNFCVMDCYGGKLRMIIKIATIEEMRAIEAAADKAGMSGRVLGSAMPRFGARTETTRVFACCDELMWRCGFAAG